MKYIILISGSGGVGKDKFIECFANKATALTFNISTIEPVKEIAKTIGWSGQKEEKDRKFLSDLKQLFENYNNFTTEYAALRIKKIPQNPTPYIFVHCREEKYRQKLISYLSEICPDSYVKTLLITNSRVLNITTNEADRNVYDSCYDYVIQNEGTIQNLENKAIEFKEWLDA